MKKTSSFSIKKLNKRQKRNVKTAVILISFFILILFVIFQYLFPYYVNWKADQEIRAIALKETQNITGDKEKAFALSNWLNSRHFSESNKKTAEDVYLTNSGGCVGFSNLFVFMANSIGLPARRVGTNGETHFWVEIFSNRKWINLEPIWHFNESYDNPKFYVDGWNETYTDKLNNEITNYHKRLSFVFWEDGSGNRHDLTSKYVDTGRLIVKITKNSYPINARVVIKSHHLKEAYPEDSRYNQSFTSLIEDTDSSGVFEKDLGPNTYTVIVEHDIIPFMPSFFVFKDENSSIEVKKGEEVLFESKNRVEFATGELYSDWIQNLSQLAIFPLFIFFTYFFDKKFRRKLS
jgi:hypothetical protein